MNIMNIVSIVGTMTVFQRMLHRGAILEDFNLCAQLNSEYSEVKCKYLCYNSLQIDAALLYYEL